MPEFTTKLRRARVKYDEVAQHCEEALQIGGGVPAVQALIAALGGGSATTVSTLRRQWIDAHEAQKRRPLSSEILELVERLSQSLQQDVDLRWEALQEEAAAAIAAANAKAEAAADARKRGAALSRVQDELAAAQQEVQATARRLAGAEERLAAAVTLREHLELQLATRAADFAAREEAAARLAQVREQRLQEQLTAAGAALESAREATEGARLARERDAADFRTTIAELKTKVAAGAAAHAELQALLERERAANTAALLDLRQEITGLRQVLTERGEELAAAHGRERELAGDIKQLAAAAEKDKADLRVATRNTERYRRVAERLSRQNQSLQAQLAEHNKK